MRRKFLFLTENLGQKKGYMPFWAMALSYLLKNRGHETFIFDMFRNDYSNEQLKTYLQKNQFDVICHSPVSSRFVKLSIPLSKIINKYKKNAKYVIGGSAASADVKYHWEKLNADIAIKGDIFGRIKEKIGFDYDLVDVEGYTKSTNGYIGIIASTGCPGKCSFCFRVTEGYHIRNMKTVVKEMKMLSERCGSNKFDILDNLFATKKNLKNFKKELNGWKIEYVCETRADCVNKEVAKLLKETGCNFVNIGFESMSDYVLKEIGKGITAEQNTLAAQVLTSEGIAIGCNFIVGFACDDPESMAKNSEFIRTFNTKQVRTLKPVTPYPGTRMFKELGKTCEDFYRDFVNIDMVTWQTMSMDTEKFYGLLTRINNILLKSAVHKKLISEITYRSYIRQLQDLYTGKTDPALFRGFKDEQNGEHQ